MAGTIQSFHMRKNSILESKELVLSCHASTGSPSCILLNVVMDGRVACLVVTLQDNIYFLSNFVILSDFSEILMETNLRISTAKRLRV